MKFSSLLWVLAAGCMSEREPPPVRVASPAITSSDGKQTASVAVRFSKGGVGVHSGGPDQLFHDLTLTSGSVAKKVQLGRFTSGYMGDTPAAEFQAAVKAEFKIAFAADGHAVSTSFDGGKTWLHVVLDAGEPFVCGSSAGLPPSSRDLVLASVGATGFAKGRTCDLDGAARLLCARSGDEVLWNVALERFFVTELVDSERYPLLACVRAEEKVSAPVRAKLISYVQAKPSQVELAAEALARSGDEAVQVAVTTALRGLVDRPTSDPRCWSRGKVAWSLAGITAQRKAAPPATRELLLELARAPDACPSELTGKAVRVYAVTALAALQDPGLKELAAKCNEEPRPWSVPFEQWNEAMTANLVDRKLECLAKR